MSSRHGFRTSPRTFSSFCCPQIRPSIKENTKSLNDFKDLSTKYQFIHLCQSVKLLKVQKDVLRTHYLGTVQILGLVISVLAHKTASGRSVTTLWATRGAGITKGGLTLSVCGYVEMHVWGCWVVKCLPRGRMQRVDGGSSHIAPKRAIVLTLKHKARGHLGSSQDPRIHSSEFLAFVEPDAD